MDTFCSYTITLEVVFCMCSVVCDFVLCVPCIGLIRISLCVVYACLHACEYACGIVSIFLKQIFFYLILVL